MRDPGAAPGSIRRRLLLLRAPLWLVVVVLAFRFWNLQVARGEEYARLAQENHLQTERLRAPRGLVTDRDGVVLAESEPSFTLFADRGGLERLAEMGRLPEDEGDLDGWTSRASRGSVVVESQLDLGEAAWYEARRRDLPGVRVDFVPARRYPLGPATAHLLGYVGEVTRAQLLLEEFVESASGDLVGQDGVERVYNAVLSGADGHHRTVVNSRQVVLTRSVRADPVRGGAVRLTVLAGLQEAAAAAFDGRAGAFAALDPRSGEVLGIGSFPAPDPHWRRRDPGHFRSLVADPRAPLLNRAVQGRYPPGSAFKLVTAAAALAEGVADETTRFRCRGSARVAGRTFRCHLASGHGELDLVEALAKSCNVFFYRLVESLDVDVIAHWAGAFGLGEATGVDLLNEAPGLLPTREWKRRTQGERWYASETASVAVGQGAVQVTPIQMARLTAAVAAGGTLHTPRLVEPVPPRVVEGFPEGHLEMIRAGMRAAVTSGTARRAGIRGFAVAGKTGTAQVANAERVEGEDEERAPELRTHAWFVGFAPFEAPEIAVAVVVEHGGGGGAAAGPVARALFEAYFDRPRPAGEADDTALSSGN